MILSDQITYLKKSLILIIEQIINDPYGQVLRFTIYNLQFTIYNLQFTIYNFVKPVKIQ